MKKLFSSEYYEARIALIYLFVSVMWIFFSDQTLDLLVTERELLVAIQTYKGWGFVVVTTLFLYVLMRREGLKLRTSRKRIDRLLEKETKNRERIEREKERLKEILLEAPSAICILEGPDHRYKYANEAYFDLVGERKLIGLPAREALPELEDQGFFELLDHVYDTGEVFKGNEVPFTVNVKGRHKTYFRNFIYKPLKDETGERYGIFVEAVDITPQVETRQELEKSIDEKQVLLQELHHRVKNNLALITGLIELEVQENGEKFRFLPLETTRNRIYAIAEIHELLYEQQSLKNIPFHTFVDRLVGILFKNGERDVPPEIEVQSAELKLNINEAVPLGLMVNEILSRLNNGGNIGSEDEEESSGCPCDGFRLSLGIDEENHVVLVFEIRGLEPGVRDQITLKDQYLPATLIGVLCRQLDATFEHTNTHAGDDDGDGTGSGNGTSKDDAAIDSIAIRFRKGKKSGSSSNL